MKLPKRSGEFVNPYSIRIGNKTTIIEVEGINYGHAAWTKVFRTNEADTDNYGLPIGQLLTIRVPHRNKKQKHPDDQLTQIRRDAADLIEYAQDVISGNFEALDELVDQQLDLDKKRLENAPSSEQKAANIACTEAGHAFKQKNYEKVVELLSPHINLLPPSQIKRYEFAVKQFENS